MVGPQEKLLQIRLGIPFHVDIGHITAQMKWYTALVLETCHEETLRVHMLMRVVVA